MPHVLIIFLVKSLELDVISLPSGLINLNLSIFLFVGGTEITKLLASVDFGFVNNSLVSPCSTICPYLITITLSVVSAMTPISWVIIITPRFLFFVRSLSSSNI